MKNFIISAVIGANFAFAMTGACAQAQTAPRAKDVVLASLTPANQSVNPAARPDALAVSVLVEGAYNMLVPRSADAPFSTGERFRIKLLSPRDGEVFVYNTNPLGQTSPTPVWKTRVKAGVETISELMQLAGNRGEDQLHVVLQPLTQPANPFNWFQSVASSGAAGKSTKDVRLVSENTDQGTYFYNPNGQGGYVTIRIRH